MNLLNEWRIAKYGILRDELKTWLQCFAKYGMTLCYWMEIVLHKCHIAVNDQVDTVFLDSFGRYYICLIENGMTTWKMSDFVPITRKYEDTMGPIP